MALAGRTSDGFPVYLNADYVRADRRIALGFIEPHFMAGFSGGYKGIFPAVADIASIMRYHDARTIGHPASTWGVLDGNPTQAQIRATRYPTDARVTWLPAGRHNRTAILPKG